MLCTTELIHLNKSLIKMVQFGMITDEERESLLCKTGLVKLKDNRWRESETAIIDFQIS